MNNLGEKIYELRSKKNMSQGDLADALLVSRQSVSKWETNSSVPDLDKIIKLCEIFEVSMDELVIGSISGASKNTEVIENQDVEEAEEAKEMIFHVTVENTDNQQEQKNIISSGRKFAGWFLIIIGCLLTAMIFLSQGIVEGLQTSILSVAGFVIVGIIILKKTKHAALWSIWVIYSYVEYYITHIVGVREDAGITIVSFLVNSCITKADWLSKDINNLVNIELGIGFSVCLGIAFIVLTIVTLSGEYGKLSIELEKVELRRLISGWIVYIVIGILEKSVYYWNILDLMHMGDCMLKGLQLILILVSNIFLQVLLIVTLAALRKVNDN